MPGITRLFQFHVLIVVFVLGTISSLAQDPDLLRHFDYDRHAPLGLKQIGVQHRERADVYDITYASPKGGVVPASLVVPKGKGPFAEIGRAHV